MLAEQSTTENAINIVNRQVWYEELLAEIAADPISQKIIKLIDECEATFLSTSIFSEILAKSFSKYQTMTDKDIVSDLIESSIKHEDMAIVLSDVLVSIMNSTGMTEYHNNFHDHKQCKEKLNSLQKKVNERKEYVEYQKRVLEESCSTKTSYKSKYIKQNMLETAEIFLKKDREELEIYLKQTQDTTSHKTISSSNNDQSVYEKYVLYQEKKREMLAMPSNENIELFKDVAHQFIMEMIPQDKLGKCSQSYIRSSLRHCNSYHRWLASLTETAIIPFHYLQVFCEARISIMIADDTLIQRAIIDICTQEYQKILDRIRNQTFVSIFELNEKEELQNEAIQYLKCIEAAKERNQDGFTENLVRTAPSEVFDLSLNREHYLPPIKQIYETELRNVEAFNIIHDLHVSCSTLYDELNSLTKEQRAKIASNIAAYRVASSPALFRKYIRDQINSSECSKWVTPYLVAHETLHDAINSNGSINDCSLVIYQYNKTVSDLCRNYQGEWALFDNLPISKSLSNCMKKEAFSHYFICEENPSLTKNSFPVGLYLVVRPKERTSNRWMSLLYRIETERGYVKLVGNPIDNALYAGSIRLFTEKMVNWMVVVPELEISKMNRVLNPFEVLTNIDEWGDSISKGAMHLIELPATSTHVVFDDAEKLIGCFFRRCYVIDEISERKCWFESIIQWDTAQTKLKIRKKQVQNRIDELVAIQQQFTNAEQLLNDCIDEKNQTRTDLENTGFFAFAKKKTLIESITSYDKQIAVMQKQTADCQQKWQTVEPEYNSLCNEIKALSEQENLLNEQFPEFEDHTS